MATQKELTEKVFKEFVKDQSRNCHCGAQVQLVRPRTLSLQERAQLPTQVEEVESPPLLSPDLAPRSQSDPHCQVVLNVSARARAMSDEQMVTNVVKRLKVVAGKIDKSSCHQSLTLAALVPSLSDRHLSWEGVAELFTTIFNVLRERARVNPTSDLDEGEIKAVFAVVSLVSDWVCKNGGWLSFLSSPTLPADQSTSPQTQDEGAVSTHFQQAAVGTARRNRDISGAPMMGTMPQKIPLSGTKSCVELTHGSPKGSPAVHRNRACSDPNVPPLSHCPAKFLYGLAKELFEMARKSLWDENVSPSPDSQN